LGRSRGAGLGHAGNLAPLCRRTKRDAARQPASNGFYEVLAFGKPLNIIRIDNLPYC
jgi:hypothetical protein